jgi:hypothetical protein
MTIVPLSGLFPRMNRGWHQTVQAGLSFDTNDIPTLRLFWSKAPIAKPGTGKRRNRELPVRDFNCRGLSIGWIDTSF